MLCFECGLSRQHGRDIKGLTLFDNAAGHARPAAAQHRRMIGMIVGADMQHQRPPLQITHAQTRRQHRLHRHAAGVNI